MSTQPLTGGSLRGVTREEAVALKHGLLELLDRFPEMEHQPLVVGMTRLLLSVPKDTEYLEHRVYELEQGILDDHRIMERLLKENADFRHLVTEQSEEDQEKARLEQEAAQKGQEIVALGQKATRLQDTIDGLNRELQDTRAQLTTSESNAGRLRTKVGQAEEQAALATRNQDEALGKLKAAQQGTEAAIKNLAGMKNLVQAAEWSALHPRFTMRVTGQTVACPCCPVCKQLNPAQFPKDRDAGHLANCSLGRLIAKIVP